MLQKILAKKKKAKPGEKGKPSLLSFVVVLVAFLMFGCNYAFADWRQFRGPSGTGITSDRVPDTWDDAKNLKWVVPLPGSGCSSPIVVGNRVFVTAYSGYGLDDSEPGNIAELRRHLICVDRQTGKIAWMRTTPASLPEDQYKSFITDHGYASNTPVSDGERVYVFYGKSGVIAFSLDGEPLWQTPVGKESSPSQWGSAASLILHKNLVIVNACDESQSLLALDKKTGKEVWRAQASKLEGAYCTPLLVELPQGGQEIVLPVSEEIWGFEPDTGKLKWYVEKSPGKYMSSTPTAGDGVVYAAAGRAIAVKVGGSGNVTDSHTLWTRNAGAGVPSPVLDKGRLYWLHTRGGTVTCIDAKTGERLWRERIPSEGGSPTTYASLIKAGNRFYATSQTKGVFVFAVEPEFKLIAQNRFEHDSSVFKATPAVSDGELFLRSERFLYCVAHEGNFDLASIAGDDANHERAEDSFSAQFDLDAVRRRGHGGSGGRATHSVSRSEWLLTLDENNDFRISKEEMSPIPEFVRNMLLTRGDLNKDGFINTEERLALDNGPKRNANAEEAGRKRDPSRPKRPGDPPPAGSSVK